MKDKGHRWSDSTTLRFCENNGCTWVCFPNGIPGDPRIRYAAGLGTVRQILTPHPCNGRKEP